MSEEAKPPVNNSGESTEAKPAAAEAKAAAPVTPQPAAAKAPPPKEPPPPPPPGEFGTLIEAAKIIKGEFKHLGPDAIGVEMIDVAAGDLLEVARFLKSDSRCRFDLLVSVTGIDWKDRLESVVHLYSTETYKKLVVKTTAVDEHVPSLMPVWTAADWHERETYDLLGIIYDGHPNLVRILMPADWIGHPLRKDYKVTDPRLVWNER